MDFAALLATGDQHVRGILGGTVTYSPGSGDPVDVAGVFEAAYVVEASGDAQVSTAGPAVFLAQADLPSDPVEDLGLRVTVAGTVYRPREVKPDGLGGVLLLLNQV